MLCTSFFLSKQTGLPHCTVYSCCAPFFLSKQTGLLTIQSTVNIAVTVYCCCAPLSSFQSRQVSLIVQSTVAVHLFLPFKADRSPSLYSLQLLCTSFFLSKQTGLPHCTVYSCCAPFFLSKQTGLLTIQSTVNIAVTVYCCCAPLSSFQSRQVSLFLPFKVDRSPSFFPFKADRSPSSSFQSRQVSLFLPFKADRSPSFFLSKQTGLPLSSFQSRQVFLFLPFKADRSPSLYSLQLLCTSFFLSKQTGLPHCTVYSCCAPLSSFQSRQVFLFLPFKADRSPSLYSLQLLCTSFFLSN